MPQKAILDKNLEKWVKHIQSQKKNAFDKRTNNEVVAWARPPLDEWDGDLQTKQSLIDLHKAFNTDEAEKALIETFKPESPGNSADGIVLSLQIDYAAQAERAYRARTSQSFPRALAHYSVREKGHGDDAGPLVGQALGYFTAIIKQGAESSGGAV